MESTTQPILCCIGASVAGCPTQFLMERAFTARGLDWRAISVEVPPELLTIALDGMAAMNFKALRIYPSLAQIAVQTFGEFNPLTRFVGAATSAALTAEGWQAWDHYGFGALKIARSALDLSLSVCWLHGDTPQNRSVLAALHTESKSDHAMPARIIWTDRPETLPEPLNELNLETIDFDALCETSASPANNTPSAASNTPSAASDTSSAASNTTSAASKTPNPASAVRPQTEHTATTDLMGDFPNLLLFVDNTAALSDLQCELLAKQVKDVHLFTRGPATPRLASASLTLISELDIAIAAEAYDFQRWTKQPADCGLFRDAYDEFGAF